MLPFVIIGISVLSYIIFLIVFLLFVIFEPSRESFQYSGYDGARLVLQLYNKNDVKIVMDEKRGDSYQGGDKCIYLIPSTYTEKTVQAFVTGAHEASHAIHTRFFGANSVLIYFLARWTMFVFLILSLFIKVEWVHTVLLVSFVVFVSQQLITLTFLEIHNNYKTLQNIKKLPVLTKSDIKVAKKWLWLSNFHYSIYPFIIWWNRYKNSI